MAADFAAKCVAFRPVDSAAARPPRLFLLRMNHLRHGFFNGPIVLNKPEEF